MNFSLIKATDPMPLLVSMWLNERGLLINGMSRCIWELYSNPTHSNYQSDRTLISGRIGKRPRNQCVRRIMCEVTKKSEAYMEFFFAISSVLIFSNWVYIQMPSWCNIPFTGKWGIICKFKFNYHEESQLDLSLVIITSLFHV